jgi:hypothetical protein
MEHLLYCDNIGLVNRITSSMHHSWTNPNHCLASESDFESGILDLLHQLPLNLALIHVKGHQDDDTPVLACINRHTWRESYLDSLRKLLDKLKTQPDLKMIPLTGVAGALLDPRDEMSTSNREPSFKLLVHSQNEIGWNHLLKGRFSHHWIQLQQAYINQDDTISSSKKFTDERWLHKILNHLWTQLYTAWKPRNADLHGINKADKEMKRKAKLKPDIITLYPTAASLDYLDRRLFDKPLAERLNQPAREQAAWINIVKPTVRLAKAEADNHTRQTQHDIQAFLTPHCTTSPRTTYDPNR